MTRGAWIGVILTCIGLVVVVVSVLPSDPDNRIGVLTLGATAAFTGQIILLSERRQRR